MDGSFPERVPLPRVVLTPPPPSTRPRSQNGWGWWNGWQGRGAAAGPFHPTVSERTVGVPESPGIGEDLAPLLTSVHDLKPWPGNARTSDVDGLVQSLQVNGQYRPVIFQRSSGFVLSGNHTVEAARRLGWRQIAAVGIDVDDDQAARIVLVDNRTADLGSTDQLLVLQLVEEVGLAGTGYDEKALAELLKMRDAPDWSTYDETAADGLDMLDCPKCGLRFPA